MINKQNFILNTKTHVLHTKECADGNLGNFLPVLAGRRQHFDSIKNASMEFKEIKFHRGCMWEFLED